jgi:hypothetical protein
MSTGGGPSPDDMSRACGDLARPVCTAGTAGTDPAIGAARSLLTAAEMAMASPAFNVVSFFGPGGYDSFMRLTSYVRGAEASARGLLRELGDSEGLGEGGMEELQQRAVNQRNELLSHMRRWITPFGRAFSEAIKDEGKSVEELVAKYLLRVLQDEERLASVLARLRPSENTLDDLLTLLDPDHGPVNGGSDAIRVYAGRLARSAGELTDGALLRAIRKGRRKRSKGRQLDETLSLLLRLAASPEVTETLIRASGRTNGRINVLSKTWGGLTAVAIVGGLSVTVVYLSGVSLPPQVLTSLGFPGTTPLSLASTGTQVLAGLGAGLVALPVERGVCCLTCIKRASTGVRCGVVITVYIVLTLLVNALMQLFVYRYVPEDWNL